MVAKLSEAEARPLTAAELRRMLPLDRDAYLAAAAERATREYVNDPELTAFEAFGKEDLHGSSSATRPR
jgi:hypothetical protein